MGELEEMTEQELETEIRQQNNNLAKLTLGRLLIEGTSERIKKNEPKGLELVKEASKQQYLPAIEYKTYRDIRFKESPNFEKIKKNLELCATEGRSARACNTLAEIFMGKSEEKTRCRRASCSSCRRSTGACWATIGWASSL